MNQRTAKLLRRYTLQTGTHLPQVKRDWLTTPRNERGAVRAEMVAGMWANELKAWRKHHNLIQKEAWDILEVDENTYRSWECARNIPHRHTVIVLRSIMRNYNAGT